MKTKLLLSTLAVFFLSSLGFANGGMQIYPGTFCTGDGLSHSSGISHNWGVRAENKANAKKTVNCPAMRTYGTDGPLSAVIYIYDTSREDSVECKFQSWSADGKTRQETPMRLSGTGFVGSRTLHFTRPKAMAGGSYNFLCKLPRGSYISSYRVSE